MLPAPCRWLHFNDGNAGLYWHYANVGMVTQVGTTWVTRIQWRGKVFSAPAGSKAQGMRWIERWIAAQDGPRRKPREVRRSFLAANLDRPSARRERDHSLLPS
jgi:hypothetical protein